MYSKPLASRMDEPKAKPARIMRGTPVTGGMGAVNFASFMPQGGLPGQKSTTEKAGATALQSMAGHGDLGPNQTKAMATLAKMLHTGEEVNARTQPSGLQHTGLPLSKQDLFRIAKRRKTTDGNATAPSHNKKTRIANNPRKAIRDALNVFRQKGGEPLGHLASLFESGTEGSSAIGYDRHGGTSYGKYQIASRVGTMDSFIDFLKVEAPDIAARLKKAGSTNTGSREGKMPDEWRAIASEQPERFEKLQDTFIHASHFTPAVTALAEKTGVGVEAMPKALQEVVFSTAVQHGPTGASRIIGRALEQIGEMRLDPDTNSPANLATAQERLIRQIYDGRSEQFPSSAKSVQMAVKGRLRQEMSMVISMLRQERTGTQV